MRERDRQRETLGWVRVRHEIRRDFEKARETSGKSERARARERRRERERDLKRDEGEKAKLNKR